jgi:cysteine desulfurase
LKMNEITYLDNAATTSLDPQVLEAMIPYMSKHFGNPSSSYSIGRQSRTAVESSRKLVAEILGVKATSIYFTSGGTESNNTAINACVNELGCTHVITSPIEHHAVLHAVEYHCSKSGATRSNVKLSTSGEVDLLDLEEQLVQKSAIGVKCLVSLMHANNEIGTLLDLIAVGEVCKNHGAIFHSDCVQTIGHYSMNLKECGVHFASASGHKFHGPKGTGILYVSEGTTFEPLIHGGGQERRKRAGTENVHGIIGFSKALSIAIDGQASDEGYIRSLNNRMRTALIALSGDITFNSTETSLFTILSVNFPNGTNTDLLLALLDRHGICASSGSACSTGDVSGSHVIMALGKTLQGATLRFSFSKNNSEQDVDFAVEVIGQILKSSNPLVRV